MLVSINLLTYNSERFLRGCLVSVFGQSYGKIEFLIIDNASQDNTVSLAQEIINQAGPKFPVKIIRNEKNLGFAAGHNQGINESKGELVLCLNQDVILAPDFIEKAVGFFEKNKGKKIGSLQPKILRLDKELQKTNIIDTTGLVILKNRRIIGRGQGKLDGGQYNGCDEIFGADGAAPVYLRKALEDAKISVSPALPSATNQRTEYFDEDFFCYKEDVDIAWRMRLFGWKSFYTPEVRAWHARGAGDSAATNYFAIIKERLKISRFAKYVAFRNQRLIQIKNDQSWLLFKHMPWFLPKEIGAWGYALLFEKDTIKAIKEIIKLAPGAWQKRKEIMARKKSSSKEMEKWFI